MIRTGLVVRVQVRFTGWLFEREPWRGVPGLGETLVLDEEDLAGCVMEVRTEEGMSLGFATAYADE